MLLAMDLGTTNWKAAVFQMDGTLRAVHRIPSPVLMEEGVPCFDPLTLRARLEELVQAIPAPLLHQVRAAALTGMAEAGLLLHRKTGRPLSSVWPWHDPRALPLYQRVRDHPLFSGRGQKTGLPNSPKYGIYKLLTLLDRTKLPPGQARWLGLVAYAGFLLTGEMAEEETLAARSYAYDIAKRDWDVDFLLALGLDGGVFPPLIPSGSPMGLMKTEFAGLAPGVPVCLCGHDHVCAAHALNALEKGDVFLSMGTAQVILGTKDQFSFRDAQSGLSYGPSPAGAPYTCLGSIQSAGGSVNYWKELMYPGGDFQELIREAQAAPAPAGLVYFPYLSGSGAPHLNPQAKGALLGLSSDTPRGTIAAAVYEGIAMETRYVLESMGLGAAGFAAMGGLTRHHRLMQVLSDVTGLEAGVPELDEGTLYGAARLAAQRALGETGFPPLRPARRYSPDARLHKVYDAIYSKRYLPLLPIAAALGEWEDR